MLIYFPRFATSPAAEMTGPEILSSCLGSPTFFRARLWRCGAPSCSVHFDEAADHVPSTCCHGGLDMVKSKRHSSCADLANISNLPLLLPRPYGRVYTRSTVHGGSAQRGWVERIPLYPTALRAFVFSCPAGHPKF